MTKSLVECYRVKNTMRMFILLNLEYLIYAFIDIIRGLDLNASLRLWLLGTLSFTDR